jgi:hypothetical protein
VDVDIALLYQLEVTPPAKVVLVLARAAVEGLTGAAADAVVNGLRVFVRDEPTEFRFDIVSDGDKVLALVKTNDTDVVTQAVPALSTLGTGATVVEFDAVAGAFKPLAPT